MTKIVGLRVKTYSCLIEKDSEDKKAKSMLKSMFKSKKCVIKKKIKFENY